MKLLIATIFFSSAFLSSTVFANVSFQIFQSDPKLKNILGKNNDSMLCWPSSVAHRMHYLQKYQSPPLTKLKLKDDPVENVEKFVKLCRTSVNGGTSQKRKLPCIRQTFAEAGYKVDAFSVGPDAEKNKRAVTLKDLQENLQNGYAVILHVAWWKFDEKNNKWEEKGSHSVNVYGYENSAEEKIVLKVANPGIDYSKHPLDQMYDHVQVKKLEKIRGISYPPTVDLTIAGAGFDRANRIALIKNIFVFKAEM